MASTNNDNDNVDIRSDTSEKSYVAIETTRNPDGSDVPDEDQSASGAESYKRDEATAGSALATTTARADGGSKNAGVGAAVTTSTTEDDAHSDTEHLREDNQGVHDEYLLRKFGRQKSFPRTTGDDSKGSR